MLVILVYLENVLNFLNKRISKCREFIKNNESVFSLFFSFLFAIEQAFLIILTYIYQENSKILVLIISIFALIVILTASLEKFILEIKRRYDKEQIQWIESLVDYRLESYSDNMSRLSKKLSEIMIKLKEKMIKLKSKEK